MGRIVRSALAMMVVGAAACGGDGSSTTEPDVTEIRVNVTADDSPRSGVTARLYAVGGTAVVDEEVTGSNGRATFTGLEASAYDVQVVVPSGLVVDGGAQDRRTVTVMEGATSVVTFALVTPIPANVSVVTLQSTSFSPSEVSIDAGMTIRWVNGTATSHTITPDGHSQWTSQSMTSDGQVFEHTFNTAGSYPYECQLHAGMTGTITVN